MHQNGYFFENVPYFMMNHSSFSDIQDCTLVCNLNHKPRGPNSLLSPELAIWLSINQVVESVFAEWSVVEWTPALARQSLQALHGKYMLECMTYVNATQTLKHYLSFVLITAMPSDLEMQFASNSSAWLHEYMLGFPSKSAFIFFTHLYNIRPTLSAEQMHRSLTTSSLLRATWKCRTRGNVVLEICIL